MLSPVQQVILRSLLIPENPRGFKKYQHNEASRKYVAGHPAKVKAAKKRWVDKNPEAGQRVKIKFKNAHPTYAADYVRDRERRDPGFKTLRRLRNRVYYALRGIGAKSIGTLELLGCGIPHLRGHLEAKFKPGMTWENYGRVWHIDHRRPCIGFDLTDPVQQRECFHYTNLQPLFAEENLKKGAR